jgi:hypothetical protein
MTDATTPAKPDAVFNGYTQAELAAAMKLVENPEHWKMAVDTVVPKGTDLDAIAAALLFFAGSPAEFIPAADGGTRVLAAGYFACIGA